MVEKKVIVVITELGWEREFEVDVKKPVYMFIYEVVQQCIDAGNPRAKDLYGDLVSYGLFYSPETTTKSQKPVVKEVEKQYTMQSITGITSGHKLYLEHRGRFFMVFCGVIALDLLIPLVQERKQLKRDGVMKKPIEFNLKHHETRQEQFAKPPPVLIKKLKKINPTKFPDQKEGPQLNYPVQPSKNKKTRRTTQK
jgi:hypothetical protein